VTDANVNKGEGSVSTSLSLLERARRREPGAWERMASLYAPLVYGWCRKHGLQPADAEDVGQEVFASVCRGLGDFRRDRPGSSFRRWLYRITVNAIREYWRKNPRALAAAGGSAALAKLAELPEEDSAAEAEPAEDLALLVRQALKQLEPEFKAATWQAFWRVSMEGQPAAEVAQALGVTTNAVYLAGAHVRRRFREEFADLVEQAPSVGKPEDDSPAQERP
jgi:RNA polymerase sigma-70 factor (ECF subfamily)